VKIHLCRCLNRIEKSIPRSTRGMIILCDCNLALNPRDNRSWVLNMECALLFSLSIQNRYSGAIFITKIFFYWKYSIAFQLSDRIKRSVCIHFIGRWSRVGGLWYSTYTDTYNGAVFLCPKQSFEKYSAVQFDWR